jgi:hypothetical protein
MDDWFLNKNKSEDGFLKENKNLLFNPEKFIF